MSLPTRPDPSQPPRAPSPALAEVLRQMEAGYDMAALPPVVMDEAGARLAVLEARLVGADAKGWDDFLRPLGLAVRNPPARGQAQSFASACATVLGDIPAELLTGAAQRDACRRFTHWPSVAELDAWLRPQAAALLGEAAALRRALRAPAAQARPREPLADPGAMAALAAERMAAAGPPEKGRRSEGWSPPSGLRPDRLAGVYDAAAARAAEAGEAGRAASFRDRAARLRGEGVGTA
jgi:hypothetical protein